MTVTPTCRTKVGQVCNLRPICNRPRGGFQTRRRIQSCPTRSAKEPETRLLTRAARLRFQSRDGDGAGPGACPTVTLNRKLPANGNREFVQHVLDILFAEPRSIVFNADMVEVRGQPDAQNTVPAMHIGDSLRITVGKRPYQRVVELDFGHSLIYTGPAASKTPYTL